MALDPTAIGVTTDPVRFEWTDRETMLYALGVGAGTADLAFTTENSHDIPQQVLPTYAVICCMGFAAVGKIGTFNPALLLHGSQEVRLFAPLPPAGSLQVVAEVADIQDKGEGKNAVVMLRARGTDSKTSEPVVETLTTLVIRKAAWLRRGTRATGGRAADPGRATGFTHLVCDPGGPGAAVSALR